MRCGFGDRTPARPGAPAPGDFNATRVQASARSIVTVLHRGDLKSGAPGVTCAFGAGYSVGSAVVKPFVSVASPA